MMRPFRVLLAAAALGLFAMSSPAGPITFATNLGPEAVGATGTGFTKVDFDPDAHTLRVQVTFSGLSGTTTVAHIHAPTAAPGTGTVGVAFTPGTLTGFPSGLTSGSYDRIFNTLDSANYTTSFLNNFGGGTAAGAEAALVAYMTTGRAYLNVHTNQFQGGEIRGFLTPVPEPGSLALLGTALVGLAGYWRRRTRSA